MTQRYGNYDNDSYSNDDMARRGRSAWDDQEGGQGERNFGGQGEGYPGQRSDRHSSRTGGYAEQSGRSNDNEWQGSSLRGWQGQSRNEFGNNRGGRQGGTQFDGGRGYPGQYGNQYAGQYGNQYGNRSGGQYGSQYGNPSGGQYGSQYGNQYGNPGGNQYGNQYDGGQYGNQYGQSNNTFGSSYDTPTGGGYGRYGQYGGGQPQYGGSQYGEQYDGGYGGSLGGNQDNGRYSGSYGSQYGQPQNSPDYFGSQNYPGSMQQHRGKGPKGYARSDERLKEDISERLMDDAGIDASDISIQVREGVVTLEGSVNDRQIKHRAEDLVERCSGVKDVENRLTVKRAKRGGESESATESIGSNDGNTKKKH